MKLPGAGQLNVRREIGGSARVASRALVLLLCKLPGKMTFHLVTGERISGVCQHNRINDRIACQLGGDKRSVLGQFLVVELYASAACK